jgi:2-oxoglutarate ferredoxin oxidoreductase subunit gamma
VELLRIRVCGFGGQGIVLAGVILGHAAVIEGKNAVQTQSYGSESRGGASKADVIISSDPIYEVEPAGFDCLVAMSPEAYKKYLPTLVSDGTLVLEKTVLPDHEIPEDAYAVSATYLAESNFGRRIMANMIMLGFTNAILEQPTGEAMVMAIRNNVPEGTAMKNIEAFKLGYREGLKATGREENG